MIYFKCNNGVLAALNFTIIHVTKSRNEKPRNRPSDPPIAETNPLKSVSNTSSCNHNIDKCFSYYKVTAFYPDVKICTIQAHVNHDF